MKNVPVKDLFTVAIRTVFKFSIYICMYIYMYVCMYVCRRINETEDRSDRSQNSRSRKQKRTEIKGRFLRIIRANILHIFI